MLPMKHALALGGLMLGLSGWLMAQRAGYKAPALLQRLGVACEKYGLPGYATACHLAAGRGWGRAAAQEGDRTAARASAERACDEFVDAARLLTSRGSGAEAGSALTSALRAAPWRSDVRARLLEADAQRGSPQAVRRLMNLAYREDDPEAQLVMARLYLQQRRPDDAAASLKHALALRPNHYGLRMAMARYLLTFQASADAAAEAQAAEQAARSPGERLAAIELLRSTGGPAPSGLNIRRQYFLQEYAFTARLLLLYLLALVFPALWRSARRRWGPGSRHDALTEAP